MKLFFTDLNKSRLLIYIHFIKGTNIQELLYKKNPHKILIFFTTVQHGITKKKFLAVRCCEIQIKFFDLIFIKSKIGFSN